MQKSNVVCFLKNYLSNFYKASFYSDLYGQTFKTTEQYFMYEKAIFFNDAETAEKILEADTPQKAKDLGRQVKNYIDSEWAKIRYDVMLDANILKFTQNHDIKVKLLETKDKTLIECNINDKIWSCGLALDNPDALDETKWTGQNLLGKVLMEVRTYLEANK